MNPYTPGNLWREISHYGSSPATAQTFEQDHGEKLYRRSLYTYWKRTSPPPNMPAFDAPNREICTITRPSTTTPLQALVLLNDVQFVEAARAFADHTEVREAVDHHHQRSFAQYRVVDLDAVGIGVAMLDLVPDVLREQRAGGEQQQPSSRAWSGARIGFPRSSRCWKGRQHITVSV